MNIEQAIESVIAERGPVEWCPVQNLWDLLLGLA